MIKIRYRDPQELSPGLHAAAERHGRTTIVYLLPGLTATQRRAALRRLRMSAQRGYAPRLPTPQLVVALLAYRVRTMVGQAGAVFRSHPAGSTVPVMVVSAGAIAFLALSAVSVQVIHPPRNPGRAWPGAGQVSSQPAVGSRPGASVPGGTGRGGTGSGASSHRGASRSSGGGTTVTGGAAGSPAPAGSSTAPATGSSSAAATRAASAASASPAPSASKSACLNVGPLGICP